VVRKDAVLNCMTTKRMVCFTNNFSATTVAETLLDSCVHSTRRQASKLRKKTSGASVDSPSLRLQILRMLFIRTARVLSDLFRLEL